MKRFQWRVLRQSTANSPTLCQYIVASAIQSIKDYWLQMYVINSMHDILIVGKDGSDLLKCYNALQTPLQNKGLELVPDKVQLTYLHTHLGFQMRGPLISSQKIQLSIDKLKTLCNFQKLLRVINWLTLYLKLSEGELKPIMISYGVILIPRLLINLHLRGHKLHIL